jgi:hypothetical protein
VSSLKFHKNFTSLSDRCCSGFFYQVFQDHHRRLRRFLEAPGNATGPKLSRPPNSPMFLPRRRAPCPYPAPNASPDKSTREHAMAPLLRKKLVCFYCGQASSRRRDGTVREWLCQKCDAVNYLDEVRFACAVVLY